MDTKYQDVSRELLITLKITGTIIDITPNCYQILGFHKTEMIESKLNDYLTVPIELTDEEKSDNLEWTFHNKEGETIIFDAVISSKADGNKLVSLINISKYKEIELWEKRFRNMLENTKDIVYLYNIIPEAKFVYVSKAIEESLGNMAQEAYGDSMHPFNIAHPDELHVQYEKINKDSDFSKPFHSRMKNKNGEYIWFEDNVIPFFNKNGELEAISGFCRNIQDRKELEHRLEELSYHDSLTGLFSYNYYHIQEKRLNQSQNASIGIIMCDLDNLKMINDSFGHPYGDKLLINFANLLKRDFGNCSVLVRAGGDEFIILLENTTQDEVENIYHGLGKSMEEFNQNSQFLQIKASIGWAYSPTSIGVIKRVYKSADDMMYENKTQNRRKNLELL